MRKLAPLVVVGAAVLLVSITAGCKGSESKTFSADLTVDRQVANPEDVPSGAGGHFTATLSDDGTLEWTLTFENLSGAASESHVHGGVRGPERFQAVIVPLCGAYLNYGVPCESGISGTAKLSADSIALLSAGNIYVNVHTDANPEGEIRGTIEQP